MNVGDWINVTNLNNKNKKTLGYIVYEDYYRYEVQPRNIYDASIKVYKSDRNFEIIGLELDDKMVDDMIDLALKIKDEKWFYELIEMRSR